MSKTKTTESNLSSIVVGADKDMLRRISIATVVLGMSKKQFVSSAIESFMKQNAALKDIDFDALLKNNKKQG